MRHGDEQHPTLVSLLRPKDIIGWDVESSCSDYRIVALTFRTVTVTCYWLMGAGTMDLFILYSTESSATP